jgi:hypothetical protein
MKHARTRKKVPITSFIVRSITEKDRKLLDIIARKLYQRTDSGALGAMVRSFANEIERRESAERRLVDLTQRAGMLVDALDKEAVAIAAKQKARKLLDGIVQDAFRNVFVNEH